MPRMEGRRATTRLLRDAPQARHHHEREQRGERCGDREPLHELIIERRRYEVKQRPEDPGKYQHQRIDCAEGEEELFPRLRRFDTSRRKPEIYSRPDLMLIASFQQIAHAL